MIIDLENAKGDIQYEVDILQRKLEEHVKKTKYLKKQLRAWEKNICDLQVKDQGSIQ
jgi:peptidoglycan hydrolase CwlO-like protein